MAVSFSRGGRTPEENAGRHEASQAALAGQDYEVASVNDPIDWIPDGQVEVVTIDITDLNGLTVLAGHDKRPNLSYGGVPETVEKLEGHVATKMLHLTWKPRGPGFSDNVPRSEDGRTPQRIGTTTQTNFKDRSVVEGVPCTYAVTAVDPVHGAESAAGETVSLHLRR